MRIVYNQSYEGNRKQGKTNYSHSLLSQQALRLLEHCGRHSAVCSTIQTRISTLFDRLTSAGLRRFCSLPKRWVQSGKRQNRITGGAPQTIEAMNEALRPPWIAKHLQLMKIGYFMPPSACGEIVEKLNPGIRYVQGGPGGCWGVA